MSQQQTKVSAFVLDPKTKTNHVWRWSGYKKETERFIDSVEASEWVGIEADNGDIRIEDLTKSKEDSRRLVAILPKGNPNFRDILCFTVSAQKCWPQERKQIEKLKRELKSLKASHSREHRL